MPSEIVTTEPDFRLLFPIVDEGKRTPEGGHQLRDATAVNLLPRAGRRSLLRLLQSGEQDLSVIFGRWNVNGGAVENVTVPEENVATLGGTRRERE